MKLGEERESKNEITQDLERYKVYLLEAEGLLSEMNDRYKSSCEDNQFLQKEMDDYKQVID